MKTLSIIFSSVCFSACLWITSTKGVSRENSGFNFFNLTGNDSTNILSFVKVYPFKISIIPPSNGVQFYKDGIVYLVSSKSSGKMSAMHKSFGKIDASYSLLMDSVLGNPSVFSNSKLFPYPCDAITFSSDFNTMYFTKYSKAWGEKIFKATISPEKGKKGEWNFDTNPVSFCSDNAIYTHPALSFDGNMIVFCSNRSGTVGGMDLFLSKKDDENWSEPVNLGGAINTSSNELFPCLDSDNNLYFSSDRLRGFGGYDIYLCKFDGVSWGEPVNLSKPVNTNLDDVAFTISKNDEKKAFYTVKQKSSNKAPQLFIVTINYANTSENLSTLPQIFLTTLFPKIKFQKSVTAILDSSAKNLTKTKETQQAALNKVIELQTKHDVTSKPENKIISTDKKPEVKDKIVFRVQILSTLKSKGSVNITISNTDYNTFEYLYKGAYRTCVGTFSNLSDAKDLQNKCRLSGYPQAFIVAFKNNVRSTEEALFK